MAGPAINVQINGDESDLKKAFRGAGDAINGFGGTFKRTFNTILSGGVFSAIDKGVESLFSFGQTGIKQFDTLGDSLTIVDKNVAGLSKTVEGLDFTKLGFDKIETANAAKDITNVAESLGVSDKQTKKMTPNLIKAAAAFSALTGTDAAGSSKLIAQALGGNAKAAKALGVEFKKGATPAENYAAIMAKFGPLADDAANGTRSLADEQDTLNAQISDISTTFGGFLNDALVPILKLVTGELIPGFQKFAQDVGPTVASVFGSIADVLGKVGGFVGGTLIPRLQKLATAFVKAFGPGIQSVLSTIGNIIQTVLIPAFNNFQSFVDSTVVPFIINTLIPAIESLATWLGTNLPPVVNALAGFFNTVLLPALTTVGNWVANVLVPAIGSLVNWLGTNLPPVVTALANFFQNTLLPALQTVGGFITDKVIPAIQVLAGWVTDTLIPAIQNLATWLGTNLGPIVSTLADAFNNVLLPALQTLFGFITDTVLPALGTFFGILGDIATLVAGALTTAFNALKGPLQTITDILNNVLGLIGKVIDGFANLPFIKDIFGGGGGGGGGAGGPTSFAPAAFTASNLLAGPSGAQTVAARVGTAQTGGDTFQITIQTTGDSLAIERAVNRAMTRNVRLNGGLVVPVRV
jgi:phage-related protein